MAPNRIDLAIRWLRQDHQKATDEDETFCSFCDREWPCDTILVCDEVERLRGELEKATDIFDVQVKVEEGEDACVCNHDRRFHTDHGGCHVRDCTCGGFMK